MSEFIENHPRVMTDAPSRHSGLGIASFVMGLVNLLLFFAMIVQAVSLVSSSGGQVNEQAPATIMLGLFVIFIGLICLIGTGLGIASIIQKQRRRLFGIIGLCLNGGALLMITLVIVIGLLHP